MSRIVLIEFGGSSSSTADTAVGTRLSSAGAAAAAAQRRAPPAVVRPPVIRGIAKGVGPPVSPAARQRRTAAAAGAASAVSKTIPAAESGTAGCCGRARRAPVTGGPHAERVGVAAVRRQRRISEGGEGVGEERERSWAARQMKESERRGSKASSSVCA